MILLWKKRNTDNLQEVAKEKYDKVDDNFTLEDILKRSHSGRKENTDDLEKFAEKKYEECDNDITMVF